MIATTRTHVASRGSAGTVMVCRLLILTWAASTSAADRIHLNSDMLINLSGQRPAVELIDEQDLADAPRAGDTPQPKTVYSNGWQNAQLYYPLSIVVDLGTVHDLTEIRWFDAEGQGRLTIDLRRADAWESLFVDELKEYRTWSSHKTAVSTRYLRLTFENPSAQIGEIAFYGTTRGPQAAGPKPVPHRQALMDSFIGINGFVDDPIERITACGHLREYHSWQWDEGNQDSTYPGYPDHRLAWSPSWVSGPGWGWDFDAFYRQLKNAGVEVAPCLQGCAPYLIAFDPNRSDEKPVANQDTIQPRSYIAHASYLFQFAARYGSTRCDPSLLKLKPGQPVRSGLGLVRYVENWNEPDKWWKDRASCFSPFELAAMCSADYDGHEQTLGPAAGIKNADPNMKLVMGGLARPEIEYLKAMKLWAEFHRNGEFPADVINLHHYSNDSGGQGGNPTTGISPEADGLRERFERIVRWRDRFLPGKEVWVSEFGYDTNPQSTYRAPAIGSDSAEEVQGRWIVRSYLALTASGVDRVQLFMLRDVNAGNPVQFNSSGLTAEKWNQHRPKRAWYYVAALRHALRGTRFESEIPSSDANVRIYRFRSEGLPIREVYAAWCPTSNSTAVDSFSLSLPNATTATVTTLDPQSATGRSSSLAIEAGKATFAVSESPVFVTAPGF